MMFLRLRARLWHPVILLCALLAVLAVAVPPAARPASDRWIVLLEEDAALERILDVEQPDTAGTEHLFRATAATAQARFLAAAAASRVGILRDIEQYWIVSAIGVTAEEWQVQEIRRMRGVRAVVPNETVHLIDAFRRPAPIGVAGRADDGDGWTYGLKLIHKPDLKKAKPQIDGRGVVVGQIDTGILASHVEFKGLKIVFKDFVGGKRQPYDDNGHGTHISGTILGRGVGEMQIGVAPGVTKLYVGKAFNRHGAGDSEGLLRAMQWMADPDGNPDTKDAPRLVSNSWGGGPGQTFYRDVVRKWVSLGIFPCFAAGNSGPRERTVGSPGGFPESFAVGATDNRDKIAVFSSRGPATYDGREIVKPDVSAPGVAVLSAYIPTGGGGDKDKRYLKASGTSMATPHVAGAIALLYCARPQLKVEQVRELLEATTDPLETTSGKDNVGGAGRINVMRLVQRGLAAANE